MEIYIAVISVLIALGSMFGLMNYTGNKLLFDAAWHNKKYFRTIFIMLLHGPIVWLVMILKAIKYVFLFLHILICWGLQEVPKDSK